MATDDERLNWGIAEAERQDTTISDAGARCIAAQLHVGFASAYLSLATTGAIDSEALGDEILTDWHDDRTTPEVR